MMQTTALRRIDTGKEFFPGSIESALSGPPGLVSIFFPVDPTVPDLGLSGLESDEPVPFELVLNGRPVFTLSATVRRRGGPMFTFGELVTQEFVMEFDPESVSFLA
jgi:hypothetical protein